MRPVISHPQIAIVSASVTNGETATAANIDTVAAKIGKASHLIIGLVAGTTNNVTNKFQTLKLQESATTDASNYSDISGTVAGTDYTLANGLTTGANCIQFNLNLQGRKRYIRIQVSPRTTQIMNAMAFLAYNHQGGSADYSGVMQLVEA